MDPLSFTASIIALLTFAGRATSAVTILKKAIKTVPSELDSLFKELRSLSLVLSRLQTFVSDTSPELLNTHGLEKADELTTALRGCETTLNDIILKVSATQALLTGRPLGRVRQSLTWSSTKEDLCGLRIQLEHYKTAIMLSLQLQNLQVVIATSKVSKDTGARVKELLDQFQARGTSQSPSTSDGNALEQAARGVYPGALHTRLDPLVTANHGRDAGETSANFLLHSNPGPFAACSYQEDESETRWYSASSQTYPLNLPDSFTQSRCPQMDKPFGRIDPAVIGLRVERSESVVETYSDIGSWLSTFRVRR